MAGKYGVKETKELLTLIEIVAVCIMREVQKDGFQVTDLASFLTSPDFEKALAPALKDVQLVPLEMTDLDVFDGLEIGKHAYAIVQNVLKELKSTVKVETK